MLISQRFVVNKLKALGIIIPEKPSKVDDDTVDKVLIYSGAHQRLLSLARCRNITNTALQNLHVCHSLLYLNLSYTCINDITAISHCVNLKGVNLAGTNMQSYEPLKWLNNLEILNLNCSAIQATGDNFKELRLLRSLDLGGCSRLCSLGDLEFLATGQLTRLEELYLDSTPTKCLTAIDTENNDEDKTEQLNKEAFHKFFDKIAEIDSLSVINIGNTPAVKYAKYLSNISKNTLYVLSKPRSYYWFLNIINNDHEEVRQMILNGMDVNIRAGQLELDLFFLAWTERCQARTPYFDCISENETIRPTGVHVALLFNSVESLKHLVRAEANQDLPVWLGSVDVESGSETDSSCDDKTCSLGKIDEEELTSDESNDEDDSSLNTDELMSLDSEGSDYDELVEKKKEEKRAAFREKKLKAKEEKLSLMRENAADEVKGVVATPGRRRTSSLKPSSGDHVIATHIENLAKFESKSEDRASHIIKPGDVKNCGSGVSLNAKVFARRVYDENIHRITEKMTERRITGWKTVSKTLYNRLENILHGDPEEFDDDYQSVASVGTVSQVSVATEKSKIRIVEEIKEEAAKKKLFSIEDIKKMYGSKKKIEETEPEVLLAKDDPDVTDDDLFLCNLRRDSNGEIVGSRGEFISEEMIRLQLQSAQSERASTGASASLTTTVKDSKALEGSTSFRDLFAPKDYDGKVNNVDKEDVSVITYETGEEGADLFENLVADEYFPHIPALEQCMPWEPMFAKLLKPVVMKVYKQDAARRDEQPKQGDTGSHNKQAETSRYTRKPVIAYINEMKKDDDVLRNELGMEYVEISFLGKKSFWLESKKDILKARTAVDEQRDIEEEQYRLERWKNFLSDSVKSGGKVYGRDARVAKPMKILYKNNGGDLTREERKEKLLQLLKENREKYVL